MQYRWATWRINDTGNEVSLNFVVRDSPLTHKVILHLRSRGICVVLQSVMCDVQTSLYVLVHASRY